MDDEILLELVLVIGAEVRVGGLRSSGKLGRRVVSDVVCGKFLAAMRIIGVR